ncbi:Alpha/Beta hydrolase protein [Aspergillus cavernicola]|uniref:Alpha/Beta hydrolase protein n=1 Tax=Aspergillus cavernicola TaxID=176166 RepID=A0ABR4ITJ3_9EURO
MRKSFVQKVANSFTRNKASRTAAEVSAGSSASAAEFSQSTHFAATSRNLREVSVRLDDYLERTDLGGSEVDLDVISMSRQIEKVRKYTNGSLPDSLEPQPLSEKELEFIKLAAWNAKAVYASDTAHIQHIAELDEFSIYQSTHSEEIDASFRDGTVKATRVQLFSTRKEETPSLLLVVAIRGSTSKRRDWTINFDEIGQGTEGDGFINTNECKYDIHGGFLECAKKMVEKVSDAISSILSKAHVEDSNKDIQLLFTGHSAGGAVASLLYAHMMSKNSSSLANLSSRFTSIDCIVFGSPPVTKPALDTYGQNSTFFSIINEGDPVPRIDKDYVESLLIIYISPMPNTGAGWDLPQMALDNAGRILFLKVSVQGLCAVPDDIGQNETKRVLETTIFGNPRAHKMNVYLWKLGLVNGLF